MSGHFLGEDPAGAPADGVVGGSPAPPTSAGPSSSVGEGAGPALGRCPGRAPALRGRRAPLPHADARAGLSGAPHTPTTTVTGTRQPALSKLFGNRAVTASARRRLEAATRVGVTSPQMPPRTVLPHPSHQNFTTKKGFLAELGFGARSPLPALPAAASCGEDGHLPARSGKAALLSGERRRGP